MKIMLKLLKFKYLEQKKFIVLQFNPTNLQLGVIKFLLSDLWKQKKKLRYLKRLMTIT